MSFARSAERSEISTPKPDAVVAALAATQHGVITTAQLNACGLDRFAIRRRVDSGRLHRVFRGVYAVGHPGLSLDGRRHAAVLAAGPVAALSHLTAADIWKVSRWPAGRIALVTASQHRPPGVDVRRCRALDPARDITLWNGIPVTNVARLLVDLTDILTPHQLAYVLHEADYRGLLDLDAIEAAMARARGRRHLARLRVALELRAQGSAGTRSGAEDRWLEQHPDSGALINVKVEGIEVDVHWPETRQVLELDGVHHRRRATRREDERRDAILEARGWSVSRRRAPRGPSRSARAR